MLLPSPANSQSSRPGPTPNLPPTPYDYTIGILPEHLARTGAYRERINLNKDANSNHLATLGRVLFYDKSLSRNNLVACASCHKQSLGFDDPSRFSIGFAGKITSRNAMGLANAGLNSGGKFFWDNRAKSLEQQVLMPFFDPIEMGLEKGELTARIRDRKFYKDLFGNAFGEPGITTEKIAKALAGFVSSIVSTRTAYDKARQAANGPLQPFAAFSDQENRGKTLFFLKPENGGSGCITCHLSEWFSFPTTGANNGGANNGLDLDTAKDQGIGAVSGRTEDQGKFRPPSLRNIAHRAPYMHDGRFADLGEVIDHYSTGIKNHPNLAASLKDDDGKPRKFNFSPSDKQALIAFLETLSDDHMMNDPKFSDPFQ